MNGWLARALGAAFLCSGVVHLVCSYAARAREASELELTVMTTLFALIMMLPKLRSRLVRRRLWVNTWMREKAALTELLQGGVIFATYTLFLSLPWAALLVAELNNITAQQALTLSALAGLTTLMRASLRRWFERVFDEVPASLFAREWSGRAFLGLGVLSLIPTTLYQDRLNLQGLSLQEALLLSGVTEEAGFGIFGLIRELATLKEVSFWWLIENIDTLLKGSKPALITITRYGLGALYTVYAISILYSFTRLVSALHELTDPVARRFFWGQAPLHDH